MVVSILGLRISKPGMDTLSCQRQAAGRDGHDYTGDAGTGAADPQIEVKRVGMVRPEAKAWEAKDGSDVVFA